MEKDFNLDKFKKKQKALFQALNKVDEIEKRMLIQLNSKVEMKIDFNCIYDLKYRIEDRIKEIQSNFYDWHFDTQGFNVY
jgi:GTPase Era involved in 16S rRNA processing